ncbi:MAG: hypothetical protein CSB01_03860 [Bacteroidia bacterium]|nr:MAG: hypothetical protein CSB01_03860 [Bacteroidia bacterium]
MRILTHHIYEYKKGLRPLALHTLSSEERETAERILQKREISYFIQEVSVHKINIFLGQKREIAYFIQEVSAHKINIFLGDANCIKIVQSFRKNSLSDYTPEQDFILGTMLGYSRKEQVNRYLKFIHKEELQHL